MFRVLVGGCLAGCVAQRAWLIAVVVWLISWLPSAAHIVQLWLTIEHVDRVSAALSRVNSNQHAQLADQALRWLGMSCFHGPAGSEDQEGKGANGFRPGDPNAACMCNHRDSAARLCCMVDDVGRVVRHAATHLPKLHTRTVRCTHHVTLADDFQHAAKTALARAGATSSRSEGRSAGYATPRARLVGVGCLFWFVGWLAGPSMGLASRFGWLFGW